MVTALIAIRHASFLAESTGTTMAVCTDLDGFRVETLEVAALFGMEILEVVEKPWG